MSKVFVAYGMFFDPMDAVEEVTTRILGVFHKEEDADNACLEAYDEEYGDGEPETGHEHWEFFYEETELK